MYNLHLSKYLYLSFLYGRPCLQNLSNQLSNHEINSKTLFGALFFVHHRKLPNAGYIIHQPRRCQSQHLQECQAPDVTKWSESWMLRIPELASAAALSWGRRCAAAALRHPVKQFEPCRFICRTLLLCNCQATVVKNLYLEKKWIQQAATSELKEVNSAGCNNED